MDTKSKSLIRITSADKNQPTHLELLRFLKENYDKETKDIITVIENSVTDENVQVILNKYQEFLTKEREVLIKKYILEKVQLMKDVYKKEK